MEQLISVLISKSYILILITLALFAFGAYYLSMYLRKHPELFLSPSKKFFNALDKKFDLDLVMDRSDIIVLKNSVSREAASSYSLGPLLEDYLKYLTVSSSDESDRNKLKSRYDMVKKIVDEENKEKPFADIPEEERRLLRSLKDAVDHNDTQAIHFNLEELRTLISARNKIYARANKINRWSLPIAIIGIITTIFFGYMSIAKSIDYDKLTKAISFELNQSQSDIKK
jgi:hypothetical protein